MLRSSLLLAVPLFALHAKPVDFLRDVRPIFSDACFHCHGPDEATRMAKLRLDTKDGAMAKVIVPGKSAESLLIKRITHTNKALHMPPVSAKVQLTEAQIGTIKQWIDEGAVWQEHWSYSVPQKPAGQVSIDSLVRARLDKEGLKPAPPADKPTLLRRVTLDLTGLPPTSQELDAFLADKSPQAYEKVVDRLLASPRFGEKMALHWLDLARYADTHGYHIDSHRDMWPWRDWVISAFNRNMPYDQFTVWQLAGDMLPNATREQKIASGFNRNHVINYEGGAIAEEYLTEYIVDRVEATSTTWLGLTVGCARCHDHKYDPIKQKDFYRFFAFFNNVKEKGLDGMRGNADPILALPNETQEALSKEISAAIKAREQQLEAADVPAQMKAWEKQKQLPEPSREGLVAHYELEGNFNESTGTYRHGRYLGIPPVPRDGLVGQAATFDSSSLVEAPASHDFDSTKPFSIAFWFRGGNNLDPLTILQQKDKTGWLFTHDTVFNIGDLRRGAHFIVRIFGENDTEALLQTKEPFPYSEFVHFALNYDGKGGFKLLQNGKPAELISVKNNLAGNFKTKAPLSVTKLVGSLDDLRIYNREITPAEAHQLAVDEPVRYLLVNSGIRRDKEQNARLREYYLTYDAPEDTRKLYARLQQLKAEKKQLDETIPTTMVMEELAERRDTHVLNRGQYDQKGEKVDPATPGFLPPMPADMPRNRLGLAQWIVSKENPLTARVAVNRFWAMYFGTGIVKTVEDFGSQGEMPSHPELLDYLAAEFVNSGWDIKAMQKKIVMSSTYRQSAKIPPGLQERDPENRLLARMSRFRLPGELIRDNALAVSGLLNGELGGKSVFPYQPPGLWEEVAYGAQFTAQRYEQSHGKDLYRRGMYSFWKRTLPPATLATFDAPDREKCVARRATTNTPLQALALWNDPTFLEAARHMAERTFREAGPDQTKRLRHMFRLATARFPNPSELTLLRTTALQQLAEYKAKPDAARQLIKIGESKPMDADPVELAAWTSLASAILNLDEVVTKE